MEASTCHNTTLDTSLILHWFFVSAVTSKIELFGTVSNSFQFLITATKNSILDVAGVLDSNLIFVLHSYILINLKPILGPVRKLGKFGNLWKLGIFFSEIFKPEFSILTVGQNRKLGNKKTRNNISKISEISEVSEFSICHFFVFQNFFFFQYSTVGNSALSISVMFCFQSLLKCFFLHQKYMFKMLPCPNEIYLLWDVSTLMRTWGILIWNSMKGFNLSHA